MSSFSGLAYSGTLRLFYASALQAATGRWGGVGFDIPRESVGRADFGGREVKTCGLAISASGLLSNM